MRERDEKAEIVKFDLLGDRRLEFRAHSVTYFTRERYPGGLLDVEIVTKEEIPYAEIQAVRRIRRKQPWTIVVGSLFAIVGFWWMVSNWGSWGPFGFGAVVFVLLGLWPLWLFWQGREYAAVIGNGRAICFPVDRKKAKVARALDLLSERIPGDATWAM